MKAGGAILALLTIAVALSAVSGQSSFNICVGRCIPLGECKEINDIFRDPVKRREQLSYLRSTLCGVKDRIALVCCRDDEEAKGVKEVEDFEEAKVVKAAEEAKEVIEVKEAKEVKEVKKVETTEEAKEVIEVKEVKEAKEVKVKDVKKVPKVSPVELPLPALGQCGRIHSVDGGTETNFDEFPWTALLEYRKNKVSIGHKCGGSLIHKQYVLTAANCVASHKPFRVRLGEWDLTTSPDCMVDFKNIKDCASPHVDVNVKKVITHPNYSTNGHNDIALIRLKRKVEFTFFIKPICLPPETTSAETPVDLFTLTGWGKTTNNTTSTKKLKVEISMISSQVCQAIYTPKTEIISSQICAGGVRDEDSCIGDIGGPLMAIGMVIKKPYLYLGGVLSFGPTPCGMEGWPGVYTRVSDYRDWILENMD